MLFYINYLLKLRHITYQRHLLRVSNQRGSQVEQRGTRVNIAGHR